MTVFKYRPALLAAVFTCLASHVAAQSDQQFVEAFSGEWFTFEPRFSVSDRPCNIVLEEEPRVAEDVRYRSVDVDANCGAPFSNGDLRWNVTNGRILIQDERNQRIAELGGNPDRLTGDLAGPVNAIILERKAGNRYKQRLVGALRKHKCYFVGYSADCADEAATTAPAFEDNRARIEVIVDLNVRSQPRRDANVVGTVPQDSQITVNLCLTASDGIWCRAGFGEIAGWMAKSVLRSNEWPVISFVSAQ